MPSHGRPTAALSPVEAHSMPSSAGSGSGSGSRLVSPPIPSSDQMRSPRSPRILSSSPVLLHPLPTSSMMARESLAQSEIELDRQQRQSARERELADALQEQEWEVQRSLAKSEVQDSYLGVRPDSGKGKGKDTAGKDDWGGSRGFVRPPQAYELYKAIDKKDIEFIMRVRDHAFTLLLQKHGGEFPILYAARIGQSHRDVVILLVGALSRYVNHLDEEDFEKKETRNVLKALRSNLKLAIDNALLPGHNPSLLSSYLQVLLMSEGDSWIHKASYDVSLLLRDASGSSAPVAAAEKMVRGFCTKELRGVPGGVGDVEEYIANAGLDLVIMAAWGIAAGQMEAEPLSTHTFARDLRTWTMLNEAMEEKKGKLGKVNRRIRGVLDKLRELAGDTKKGVRGRLRDVQEALDGKG